MNAMAAALSPMAGPQPTPQTARGDDARGGEFARCLEQAREGDAPEASEAPQRPAAKARNGREATASRQPEAGAAKPVPAKDPDDSGAAIEPDADALEAPRDEGAAPDLTALLPGWSTAAIVVPNPASSADAVDATDALQAATAAGGGTSASLPPRDDTLPRALLDVQPARMAAPITDSAAMTGLPSSASLQAAASEQKDTALGSQATAALASPAVALAAASSTPTAAAPKAAEAALPTATVQAPIDTPAFAPSLATQVRWWANNGVQQAQLLLNPAEMGPVAVRIVLDGREARIDFSADLAATRGAIEAALPVLAAALDDSGLKLTGGGVHDGSAQRQPQWSARGVTHRTPENGALRDGEPTAARGATGRGIVDLVA